jgi:selenocysteine lyase/cysteine desulfurase
VDAARAAFAALIHARPDEIAVVSNASEGISAVMSSLRTAGRREILTTDLDFPAAPTLAHRQEARGFRHVHAPLERYRPSGETALACVPAVASFTGRRMDVPAFVKAAHDAGAPLLVDAFQAAGTFDIDVRRWDVDFLVTGVYKWLMAPAGLAFLYARRDHHGRVPLNAGWQALADPFTFDPAGALAPDARRYQSGGPNALACAGAAASLDLLQEVGLARVERHNGALVDRVIGMADARKWEVLTPRDAHASIVTFRVPDLEKALETLARANVVVSSRLGGIRVSPHFYNAAEDVDRLFAALDGT